MAIGSPAAEALLTIDTHSGRYTVTIDITRNITVQDLLNAFFTENDLRNMRMPWLQPVFDTYSWKLYGSDRIYNFIGTSDTNGNRRIFPRVADGIYWNLIRKMYSRDGLIGR